MIHNPITKAAYEWLEDVRKKRKMSKHEHHAVAAFAAWLDQMIEREAVSQKIRRIKEDAQQN